MAPGLDEFDVIIRSCIVFSQSKDARACEYFTIRGAFEKYVAWHQNSTKR